MADIVDQGARSEERGATTIVELLLVNGNVRSMDKASTIATAVAIQADRLVAVGGDGQVRAAGGPRSTVVDLAGRWVIPG